MHAALDNLGWIALAEDRFDEARALFKVALLYAQQIVNAASARSTLYGLAAVAGATGDGRLAPHDAAAAEPTVRGTLVFDRWRQAEIEQKLAAGRVQTDPGGWDEAWAAGAALTLEEAVAEGRRTDSFPAGRLNNPAARGISAYRLRPPGGTTRG